MNRLTLPLTALALTASLSGCVIIGGDGDWDVEDWRHEQRHNQEVISNLTMGAARGQVLDQLGTPDHSEAFTRDGHEYRVLFYRTHHRHADGDTSMDETTPLVFEDDRLVGWGDRVLASYR